MNNLNLKDTEWKAFKFTDIFQLIERGKRLTKSRQITGYTPYVSSKAVNNGIDNFIDNKKETRRFNKGLTIANSGSVGSTFYHDYEFVASDHVTFLQNVNLSKYSNLFLSTIINRLSEKYSFNREINDQRIKREKLLLPIDKNTQPDWGFMAIYVMNEISSQKNKAIHFLNNELQKINDYKEVDIKNVKWHSFILEDIATIESGQDIYKRERTIGNTPYVTATALNNGIGYFVGNDNKTRQSNAISVNRNGSVGYAFYHPYEALYGNDTRKVIPNNDNSYVALFITAAITKQKEKYGYGYKLGTARLKKQKIMLPVTDDFKPDYNFMENYMKQLKYQKIKEALEFLNK